MLLASFLKELILLFLRNPFLTLVSLEVMIVYNLDEAGLLALEQYLSAEQTLQEPKQNITLPELIEVPSSDLSPKSMIETK